MKAHQVPAGEDVSAAILPAPDLAPTAVAQFVVRRGATYLLCAQATDGRLSFPAQPQKSRAEVGPVGVLYSYSAVHVSSTRATPYTIGYVDFPGNVRVLASVRGDRDMLRCDAPVRLSSAGEEWFVEPLPESQA